MGWGMHWVGLTGKESIILFCNNAGLFYVIYKFIRTAWSPQNIFQRARVSVCVCVCVCV
jgi:hypothetical protein